MPMKMHRSFYCSRKKMILIIDGCILVSITVKPHVFMTSIPDPQASHARERSASTMASRPMARPLTPSTNGASPTQRWQTYGDEVGRLPPSGDPMSKGFPISARRKTASQLFTTVRVDRFGSQDLWMHSAQTFSGSRPTVQVYTSKYTGTMV